MRRPTSAAAAPVAGTVVRAALPADAADRHGSPSTRPTLLAATALAAGLLVPAAATAQTIQVTNNSNFFSLNVALFKETDDTPDQPCNAQTVGQGVGAQFVRTGFCASFSEVKVRVRAVTSSNKPDCWVHNVTWGMTVNATGNHLVLTCTKQ